MSESNLNNDDRSTNIEVEYHDTPINFEIEEKLSQNKNSVYSFNNDINSSSKKNKYSSRHLYAEWNGDISSQDTNITEYSKDINVMSELNKFENLQMTMKDRSNTWFRLITFVRYKYDFYQKWNTISSVIVILLSSIITFLEALRSNVSYDDPQINLLFTLFTLTFGFIIALIASVIKFFNFQQQMENLKTAMSGIGHSYEELNRLLTKINIDIIPACDNPKELKKLNRNTREEYQKIAANAVSPENAINNILNPQTVSSYLQKYLNTQKTQIHIVNINKRQEAALEKIEENLSEMENIILDINNNPEENKFTNEKLKEFVSNIKYYGSLIFEYRAQLNTLFKTSLGDNKLEQNKNSVFNCKKGTLINKLR